MNVRKENDEAWEAATPSERSRAIDRAKWILGNLVHYYHGRSHEQEDHKRLAAELIRFQQEQPK